MDELSKEYVIDFFTKRFIHFKDKPEAVGWTPQGQLLRYNAVLELLNPLGKKLLDFGCGKGDFYGFLKEKGINCDYTGIDINPYLIDLARKKYKDARFFVQDIENEPLNDDFHYTIAIGVFNLAIEGAEAIMNRCLKILFKHTTEKLIFTCLNKKTSLKDIGLVYYDKKYLETLAEDFQCKYQVIDDLIEGDIFLILEK
ncbi:class I SAM-dependent methyltransferase [Thermodesulfovibrio hydrogeniphilus]